MFYYYKQKIPVNILKLDFSLEHICPNSSEWEGELDKDRPGNLIPIISKMNTSRGNRHINHYKENDQMDFCKYISNIIPTDEVYNKVVTHEGRKATIMNIQEYDNMCVRNEEVYEQNFIDCMFK